MKRHPVVLLLILALPACGSSPKTHFYTLDKTPAKHTITPGHNVASLEVGDVNLPSTLDRLALVTRGTGNQVNVSDQDRWAAPLDELVRRALTADLRERLPAGSVLAPGDPTSQGARTLMLNVQQFMADSTGHVVLEADWSLQRADKPGGVRHEAIQTTTNGQGAEAIADAMSRALGELADRITAAA